MKVFFKLVESISVEVMGRKAPCAAGTVLLKEEEIVWDLMYGGQ